jgi:uncharacterized protein (TIGR03663 family)
VKSRVAWLIVTALAAVFRLVDLGLKPIHFDESINGWFVGQMWVKGFYQYNPDNFHGPLYFYLLQISEQLFGFGIISLRMVSVLASLGFIYLCYSSREILGRRALWAALFFAVSPGFIFYGKTAIHEMTFVFFQWLVVFGWLQWRCLGRRGGVWQFFIGVAGCLLLKETFIIFFVVGVIAWFLANFLGEKLSDHPVANFRSYQAKPRDLALAVAGLIGMLVIVYTGFLQTSSGLVGFFRALLPWMKTGLAESGHDKPVFYYLKLLFNYEPAMLVAWLSLPFLFFSSSRFAKFFGLMAAGLFVAYSIIPYKTPWLVLSLGWPLFFFLGDVIERLLRFKKWTAVAIAVILPISFVNAYHVNWIAYDDDHEDYVYVQTKRQFAWLQNYFDRLYEERPLLRSASIRVESEDPWPLPYVFRQWTDVRWEDTRANIVEDIVFCDAKNRDDIFARLQGKYWWHVIDVRAAREKMLVFVKDDARFSPLPTSSGWRIQ